MKEQNQRRCWIFVLSMVLVTFGSAIYLSTAMFKAPSPPSLSCVNNAFGVDHEASNATGGLLIVYCQRDRPSVTCIDYRSDTHYCNGTLRSLWEQAATAGSGLVGGFINSTNGVMPSTLVEEYCDTVDDGWYIVDIGSHVGPVARQCNDTFTNEENEERIQLEITGAASVGSSGGGGGSRRRSTNDIGSIHITLHYRHDSGSEGEAVITSGENAWAQDTQTTIILPGNLIATTFFIDYMLTTDIGVSAVAYADDDTTELYTASWGMTTSVRLDYASPPSIHLVFLPSSEAANSHFGSGFIQSDSITRPSDGTTLAANEVREGETFTFEVEMVRLDSGDAEDLVDGNILFGIVYNGGLLADSPPVSVDGTLSPEFASTGKTHCEALGSSAGTPLVWICTLTTSITVGYCAAGTCTQEIKYSFYEMTDSSTPVDPLRVMLEQSFFINVISLTNAHGVTAVFVDRPSIGASPTLDAGTSTLSGTVSVASDFNGFQTAFDIVAVDNSDSESDLTITVTSHTLYDLSDTVTSGDCQLASATLTYFDGSAASGTTTCATGCDFGTEPGPSATSTGKIVVTFTDNYSNDDAVTCYLKFEVADAGTSSPVVVAPQSSNTRVIVQVVNDAASVSYFDIGPASSPTFCLLPYVGQTCLVKANALIVDGWNDPSLDYNAKSDPVACSLSAGLSANNAFSVAVASGVGGDQPDNNSTENVSCRVTRDALSELVGVSGEVFYTASVDSTFVTGLTGSPPAFSKVVALPITAQNGYTFYDFADDTDHLPAYIEPVVGGNTLQVLYTTVLAKGRDTGSSIVDRDNTVLVLDTDYKLDGDGNATLFSRDAMENKVLCPTWDAPTGNTFDTMIYPAAMGYVNEAYIEWPTVREVWIDGVKQVGERYVGLADEVNAVTKAWKVGEPTVQNFGPTDFFHLICGTICPGQICNGNS